MDTKPVTINLKEKVIWYIPSNPNQIKREIDCQKKLWENSKYLEMKRISKITWAKKKLKLNIIYTAHENLQNAAKTMFARTSIILNPYVKKEKKNIKSILQVSTFNN